MIIHDPSLAAWLINDGRAKRFSLHKALFLLTPAHLPGLTEVDCRDPVVLHAYLTAFANTIADAGYRSNIASS